VCVGGGGICYQLTVLVSMLGMYPRERGGGALELQPAEEACGCWWASVMEISHLNALPRLLLQLLLCSCAPVQSNPGYHRN
jgi:hypothetical protein